MKILQYITWASLAWAVAALLAEVWAARPRGGSPRAEPAGDPGRGMVYNLTEAMLPTHKETARHHPFKLVIGLVLHGGTFVTLGNVVLFLAWPTLGQLTLWFCRPLAALALMAGIALFFRRVFSTALRSISAPEDYAAILATCALLAPPVLDPGAPWVQAALLVLSALFFLYLPLGKLKHVVFCPASRAEFGRRLGFRGVFPPSGTKEVLP